MIPHVTGAEGSAVSGSSLARSTSDGPVSRPSSAGASARLIRLAVVLALVASGLAISSRPASGEPGSDPFGAAGREVEPSAESAGELAITPYVVGGSATLNPGYVATLLLSALSDAGSAQFCGGTLIRDDVVLTAAHCVDSLSIDEFDIAVGQTLLSDIGAGDRIPVSRVEIHPGWVSGGVTPTDLALVQLQTRMRGK